MNVFAKFDEIPSMILEVIKETKRYGHTVGRTDGRTFGQCENSITSHKHSLRGYIKESITIFHLKITIFSAIKNHSLSLLFPQKFMINVMTDFDIVNFPILDGDVPCLHSYGVYILNLKDLLECVFM